MDNFKRILDIRLSKGKSAGLWGPRKTGKTTCLKSEFKDSANFDLLDTDLFLAYERRPSLFREQVLAFSEEADVSRLIVVSLEGKRRIVAERDCKIDVLPWQDFLEYLWNDRISFMNT